MNIIPVGNISVWQNSYSGTLRLVIGEIMTLIQVRLIGADVIVGIKLRQKRRGMLAHTSRRHGNIESEEYFFL